MFATMIRKTLQGFVKPQGKKFNRPISLGLPTVKVQIACPICSKFDKNGSLVEFVAKESASAPMCKKCHDAKRA